MPAEIDSEIARLKLEALGILLDKMTEEQQRYIELLAAGHLTVSKSTRRRCRGQRSLVVAAVPVAWPVSAATDCDIVGTNGADLLIGTDAAETICGLGGADRAGTRGRGGASTS